MRYEDWIRYEQIRLARRQRKAKRVAAGKGRLVAVVRIFKRARAARRRSPARISL